jgi:hypothetical protein
MARLASLVYLASAQRLCGQTREAAATAETALGLSGAPFLWRGNMRVGLAEALTDHSPVRAIEVAQEVVRWVDDGCLGPHQAAAASLTIARALLRRDGAAAAAEAERHLARADAFGRERSGRWRYMPELSEVRAELARALGHMHESQHHLRDAHRLYVAMGATGHAARLAKELGL